MYICYFLISVFQLWIAKVKFKKFINPISIYICVWLIVVTLYESNLVYLNRLSVFAWITVILFQFVYFITCYVGSNYVFAKRKVYSFDKDILLNAIIVLSLISAFAILPNFYNFISTYSWSFMDKMNSVYNDRLAGTRGYELIPYLGTLSYLAVVFSGIYYRRYGMNKRLLIPMILALLDTLPGGGRFGLVLILFLFVMPRVLFPMQTESVVKKIGKKKKNRIIAVALIIVIVVLFVQMSSVRSRWITVNQYMSPTMVRLVSYNPVFYKTYTYIVEPLVALSEYLKDMTFNFGGNTFGFFISILNKFGFNLEYARYQEALYTPLECNVATYIRELIQDFTYLGAVFVVALIGFLMGMFYKMVIIKNDFYYEVMSAIMGTVIVMSFFMFFYRESIFWIMTILLPVVIFMMKKMAKK